MSKHLEITLSRNYNETIINYVVISLELGGMTNEDADVELPFFVRL